MMQLGRLDHDTCRQRNGMTRRHARRSFCNSCKWAPYYLDDASSFRRVRDQRRVQPWLRTNALMSLPGEGSAGRISTFEAPFENHGLVRLDM